MDNPQVELSSNAGNLKPARPSLVPQTPLNKYAKPLGLSSAGVLRNFGHHKPHASAASSQPDEGLGQKLHDLEKIVKDLKTHSEAQAAALKLSQETVAKQNVEHQRALAAAKAETATILQKQQADILATLLESTNDSKAEQDYAIKTLRAEREAAIARAVKEAGEARAALAQEAKAAREKMIADEADARSKLEAKLNSKLQQEHDEAQTAIKAVKQDYSEKIAELDQDHNVARDDLAQRTEVSLKTLTNTMTETTLKVLQGFKASEERIGAESSRAIDELKQQEAESRKKLESKLDAKLQAGQELTTQVMQKADAATALIKDAKSTQELAASQLVLQLEHVKEAAQEKLDLAIGDLKKSVAKDQDAKAKELLDGLSELVKASSAEQRELIADVNLSLLREVGDNALYVYENTTLTTDAEEYEIEHEKREADIEQNNLFKALEFAESVGAEKAAAGIKEVILATNPDAFSYTPESQFESSGSLGSGSGFFDTSDGSN